MTRDQELLLQKVKNFTDTEETGLEAWLVAAEVFHYKLSRRVLRSSLDLEHYQSVLHYDPALWTDEQRESLNVFLAAFEKDMNEFLADPLIQLRLKARDLADDIVERFHRLLQQLKG